jgi:spore coat protein U-like protein
MVEAAIQSAAAAATNRSGGGESSAARIRRAAFLRVFSAGVALASAVSLWLPWSPAIAVSNKVRITQLSDVAFGTIANLSVNAISSESICVYADTATNGYNVTASGTGPGGAFQLSSGSSSLPYNVQWSSTPSQSSGTQLTPNVALHGQTSNATQQSCGNGPATSASLIVVLPSAALSSATAGTYSGTLTLVVGAE